MGELVAGRVQDAFLEKHGVKLGFMSAFVMGAASALQEFPAVNGVIDGDDIIYRDYYDISIAVGTPKVHKITYHQTATSDIIRKYTNHKLYIP